MIRVATIVAIGITRAAIGGTLTHAVCPKPAVVVIAMLFDFCQGWQVGQRVVRGEPPPAAIALLDVVIRALLLAIAAGQRFADRETWIMGSVGAALLWFSPIAVSRIAIVLLLEPWRTPGLHKEERDRQAALAIGMTLVVTAGCVTLLFRSTPVAAVSMVFAAIGLWLVATAAIIAARRRRFVAAVRRGEIATHRVLPIDVSNDAPALDEAPDSILLESSGPETFRSADRPYARVRALGRSWLDTRRLVPFTFCSFVVTGGFDMACWHGSGWVPVRHEHGDLVRRPALLSRLGAMEWTLDDRPPRRVYWMIKEARFASESDRFRVWHAEDPAQDLVHRVPALGCAERNFIRRRTVGIPGVGPRSLAERAQIIEPIKRDGRLIYTFRGRDQRLVRAEVTLDGASSTCTVAPPPVDDGGTSEVLVGAEFLALGGSRSCALGGGRLACWGRNSWRSGGEIKQALPLVVAFAVHRATVGRNVECHSGPNHAYGCFGSDGSIEASTDASRFIGGGSVVAFLPEVGFVRVAPGQPSLEPPVDLALESDLSSVSLTEERACAIDREGSVRCWGARTPRFETQHGVVEVGVGATLACVRDVAGAIWCASGERAPVKIEGIPSATSLAVGDAHACALDSEAAVWCWGRNISGTIGDGTTVDRTNPVRVMRDAIAVATGASHSCAIERTTRVRCWGANADGQLGDGTFVDRLTPTEVVW